MLRESEKFTSAAGLAAAALAAALLLAGGVASGAGGREGELVPFFVAPNARGGTFDLRSAARQNTVVVFFWDSYKPMAVREIGFLNEIYGYYHLYGLEIAAVEGKGKDAAGVTEEIAKLKSIGTEATFPVLADPGGKIRDLYGVAEIPETFILSRRGEILFHLSGFRQGDGMKIEHKIKDLLGLLPDPERLSRQGASAAPPAAQGQQKRSGVSVTPEKQIFDKHFYFGNYYYNLGESEKALGYYLRCVEVMPEATEVHLLIGQIHADAKRYEQAREAWERILRYDPENSEADAKLRKFIRGEF